MDGIDFCDECFGMNLGIFGLKNDFNDLNFFFKMMQKIKKMQVIKIMKQQKNITRKINN